MRICSVEECDRKHYGRGYCNAHWQQVFKLKIDPKPIREWGPGIPGEPRFCTFPECGKRHEAHGLCPGHLAQFKKGEVLHGLRSKPPIFCIVPSCRKRTRRNALCDRHSSLVKKYKTDPIFLQGLLDGADKCEACRGPFDGRHESPVIDHDHKTGAIRGILCNSCNLAAGLLKDDVERIRLLAVYLERAAS